MDTSIKHKQNWNSKKIRKAYNNLEFKIPKYLRKVDSLVSIVIKHQELAQKLYLNEMIIYYQYESIFECVYLFTAFDSKKVKTKLTVVKEFGKWKVGKIETI